MQVAIVAVGSRGDVEPYVALGAGLVARGHEVRMLAPQGFAELIAPFGLEYLPLGENPRALLEALEVRRAFAAGANPYRFVRELLEVYRAFLPGFLRALEPGLEGADRVVFSTLGFPAYHWAEARGVPAVAAFLQPQTPTAAFPAPFGPSPPFLARCGLYNRFSYVAMEQFAWFLVASQTNRWRRALGLAPLSWRGPYPRLRRGAVPVLYGFSTAVVPRPRDWPDWVRVTGYWRLPLDEGWRPPGELQAFLEDGPPPVYVGFGSMRPPDVRRFTEIVLEALQLAGVRAVLVRGWGGLDPERVPDSVYVLDAVPHAWLFPRVAAVVHHGGAGTTAAGLYAGRPTVTVPFIADQFFWGERVAALGAGPRPVPAKRLAPNALARAIRAAVERFAYRRNAEFLARRLCREDGVMEAVRGVEDLA
ncbi:glycosyltransferase [Marinithermus hydrothermalis]|uniref:Sterol 3-beta-glucosyltransferase n=1 Tax=Marinithermus hydrothermalis (strain DSM 14884 / JCM 11576 / T1) TaxID=869210 RepID=F2NP97_MARHT|nr:glycosyltransferase [Marinithermus hydrothermalis]AEB11898.1 Sterol 3-beta-glucosyltransferase [Marinithermus hydrothermalis DSM 14884]